MGEHIHPGHYGDYRRIVSRDIIGTRKTEYLCIVVDIYGVCHKGISTFLIFVHEDIYRKPSTILPHFPHGGDVWFGCYLRHPVNTKIQSPYTRSLDQLGAVMHNTSSTCCIINLN